MLQILSLTLPILISGLVLILVLKKNYLNSLNVPLDHNLKINRIRLFGDNKTFRGLVVFVVTSIITCSVLQLLYLNGYQEFFHPVFVKNPILIGTVYSLSYTFGELVNSAVKRQLRISPGMTIRSSLGNFQRLIDLSDGIIAVAVVLTIFSMITVFQAVAAVVIGLGVHLATDKLMRILKLKQDLY